MKKVGQDGSFPRITSSLKDVPQFMKIVEIPEEEREACGQHFKLVWIGPVESESENEEFSKSDDGLWSDEEDIPNVQLPEGNTEKSSGVNSRDQVSNTNTDQVSNTNTDQVSNTNTQSLNWSQDMERSKKRERNRSFHRSCNQNNYNSAERKFSSKLHNYNSHANISSIEEKNYNYNPTNRNSFSTAIRNCNPSAANSSDIPPWVSPSGFISPDFQHPHNQYGIPALYATPIPCDGLLGPPPLIPSSSPYDHNFSQIRQNDSFMYDVNSWNNAEYHHPESYRGFDSGQTTFQRRQSWLKNRNSHNYWDKNKRNQDNHPFQRGNQDRNRPSQRGNQVRNHPFQRGNQDRNQSSTRENQDWNPPHQRGNQDRNQSSTRNYQDWNPPHQRGNQDRNQSSTRENQDWNPPHQRGNQDRNQSSTRENQDWNPPHQRGNQDRNQSSTRENQDWNPPHQRLNQDRNHPQQGRNQDRNHPPQGRNPPPPIWRQNLKK